MENNTTLPRVESNSIQKQVNESQKRDIRNYEVLPDDMKAIKKKKSSIMSLILPEDVPDITTYLKMRKDVIIKNVIWPKIREILLESFSTVLGVNISLNSRRPGDRGEIIPKVSYESKYNSEYTSVSRSYDSEIKRRFILYEDLYFKSEAACKQFEKLVSDLFDDQGGYIRVLQYMNQAGEDTFPEQWNYGWTSLNGFKYEYTAKGWLVSMPYPSPLGF